MTAADHELVEQSQLMTLFEVYTISGDLLYSVQKAWEKFKRDMLLVLIKRCKILRRAKHSRGLAAPDIVRGWTRSQLNKLNNLALNDMQVGKALLSIHAITGDLEDKYFLFDMHAHIVYFREIELGPNDKVFILCSQHPFIKKIEISSYQGPLLFTSRDLREKSLEFKYVLELPGLIVDSNYGIIELYGKDLSSETSTAIGQLFSEIRRRGFEAARSGLDKQSIGTYTGPDGGNPDFVNAKIKNGMQIEAVGIVVTISQTVKA